MNDITPEAVAKMLVMLRGGAFWHYDIAADMLEALAAHAADMEAEAHAHIELWGKALKERDALAARVAKMSAVLRDQASLSRDLREAANMHNAADWMDTPAARVAELEAENARLKALLREALDDLAAYIDADWPEINRAEHPSVQKRWDRDIALCREIDAAITTKEQTMSDNLTRQFRKKPVVIEAVQWTGDNIDAVMAFCAGDATYELMAKGSSELVIATLEDGAEFDARHVASRGDWIIKGVQGEFYPCKPDIFSATYDAAALPADDRVAKLVDAADAVVNRWDSQDWKSGHTLDFITQLRAALAAWEAKP
jgi:hypothetical protein